MEFRIATKNDASAWDDYVSTHSGGLAYHRFAWKSAVSEAYNFESRYLIAERNERICGVLPLIVFKRPFSVPSYVSLPYCDIGGCLADDEYVMGLLLAKAKDLAAADRAVRVELRTGTKIAGVDEDLTSCQKVRMILELPTSAETLLKSLKSKLRSQVKKPLRDGLTFQLGGSELVADFYQVFAENMRDLGSPVHSRRWIESIVKNYADNARVGLVFTPENNLAAAGIILMNGDTVSIPWASSLRRYNRQNPNLLLYWTFLSFAADQGYRYFDFGRSTPGEGTYKFKEQWGAKAAPLQWFDLLHDASGISSTSSKNMRTLVERVWSKIPLSFSLFIGPLVRRYISL